MLIRIAARTLLLTGLCLLLAACGGSKTAVRKEQTFTVVPPHESLYVVPFTTVMVPGEVNESIFDEFVDALIAGAGSRQYDFIILKRGLDQIDAEWLGSHYYITGDLFAYVEDGGCCNTTIRSRSRLRLYQPGQSEPTLVMEYPREIFFDHDYSTIAAQRYRLAKDIATTLANKLLKSLAGS